MLGQNISNDQEIITKAFLDVFKLEYSDHGVVFDTSTLKTERITEFKKYAGIHVSIDGFLDRTKLLISIDIGFGDVIFPSIVEMEYPTLLNHKAPMIQTYSIESVIAEKFEAIVSLGKANSRMKDIYDIYALCGSFDFKGETLQEALKETFANRKTKFDTIVAFEPGFAKDPYRKGLWTSFLKAKKIILPLEFDHVVMNIKSFLTPIIESIKAESEFNSIWDHTQKAWVASVGI